MLRDVGACERRGKNGGRGWMEEMSGERWMGELVIIGVR